MERQGVQLSHHEGGPIALLTNAERQGVQISQYEGGHFKPLTDENNHRRSVPAEQSTDETDHSAHVERGFKKSN